MTLPTGTVTFLFTDIEGSTMLWQKHSAAMPDALTRHHAILRQVIEAHGGYVFQIIGDAFCTAFSTACDGLNGALGSQRALHSESWGETGPIRVRMALHTGSAELRAGEFTSGEYVSGITLSRVARLLSAGHGGQVLISDATRILVENDLPQGVTLRDLGEHRLKDLQRPEHIYQLSAPDLPTDFPPLKTLDTLPNNLPIQLTSFIGREREMAQLKQLVQTTRLVTLTGAGGSGKTRLALQTATNLLDDFKDGVWLVELAPLADPALVLPSVAGVLGVREQQGYVLRDLLTEYLRQKQLLLILDNTEHLVEACAQFADGILRSASQVHLLVTSREALGIAGEHIFYVPSLQLPDAREIPAVEMLAQMESVRLFVERAVAVSPGFALTSANAFAVAQICQRLDGIPLAIELAASRMQALSVEQIAKRLDGAFRLLTGGSRTALPRQQTLSALVTWSYNLLSPQERLLLHRLSVFAGGWTLEAAEAVCAGDGIEQDAVLDVLSSLVAKSLALKAESRGETRYRFLETIRQYARDELLKTDEGASIRDRHLDYFLQFAQQADTKLHTFEELATLERLDLEHDNFRAALEWSLGEGRVGRGSRLAGALMWYWTARAHWREGLERATILLAQPEVAADALARANGVLVVSVMTDDGGLDDLNARRRHYQELIAIGRELGESGKWFLAIGLLGIVDSTFGDDPALGESCFNEGLAIAETLDEQWLIGFFFWQKGRYLLGQREFADAQKLLDESLKIFERIGDKRFQALTLRSLANIKFFQGDCASARPLYERSLNLFQEVEDQRRYAGTISMLAEIEFVDGKYDLSKTYTLKGMEIQRTLGIKLVHIGGVVRLGYIALQEGTLDSAKSFFAEAFSTAREIGSRSMIASSVGACAAVLAAEKRAIRAVPLFAFFHTFFESGDKRSFTPMGEMMYERYLGIAREQVDEATFNAGWAEGCAMTMEQAIEYAMEETKP